MGIKILLADDSITIQKVVGIIFGGEEYSLTVASNGSAAVEKARELIPDVLLVDVHMPGISGYEVCEAIRAIPALATKPILLLTGSFDPFDEEKARRCGADDFITKPFESQQIISKVKELHAMGIVRTAQKSNTAAETFASIPAGVTIPDTTTPVDDIWGAFTSTIEPDSKPSPAEAFTSVPLEWEMAGENSFGLEDDSSIDSQPDDLSESDSPFDESAFDFTYKEISNTTVKPDASTAPSPATMEAPTIPTPTSAILTEEQLRAAIAGVSREVIERIVWEVVPDLAETLIKEAIRKIREGA